MKNVVSGRKRRIILAAGCALLGATALAAPAQAAPVAAELRVEAGNNPLVPAGRSFVTDSSRVQSDSRPGCDGSGNVLSLSGPTALGLVNSAARLTPALRPLAVSDKFSFGLFVCGIAGRFGGNTQFWLYTVDHKDPMIGGDQFKLQQGQHVLWYFVDFDHGINTGKQLSLITPVRAHPNEPFKVRVLEWDLEGRSKPAANALVVGETTQKTDSQGLASVFADHSGSLRLRAVRGSDIPSEGVKICLNSRLRHCPNRRGQRIFGNNAGELIIGTRGPDSIFGRGGRDRINARGGSRDLVRCGSGRDRVRADRRDKVSRDCEVVLHSGAVPGSAR
jgi:uncharacterized protein DUF4430